MTVDFTYTILIPLVPFFVFLFIGLAGGKMKPAFSGWMGVAGLSVSFILSLLTATNYFFEVGKINDAYQKIIPVNLEWLRFNELLHIDMGILLDPISVMMLLVITTVSLMVHIYSLGYMKGEAGFSRFYAFLSLFSFSMLGLVLATNIFQMYIFWELVGVSSYLLIGFYYDRPSAVSAAKKAFIVTRFADLGFLIGILLLSYTTGTFDFAELTSMNSAAFSQTSGITFLGLSTMTWALLLIFMGGAGKSAMFPLHIWLPDAMEGPTPVSALIHAATMVVAGVYLVARLFPLYVFSAPHALEIVGYIGGISSLFAAVIACTQVDIKKILAYSTMSQIGYMMLALGVSGYGAEQGLGFMASMFHLFTHAMFKALLFLGAGSVIHAVHSNNFTEMGGLRKYLPITHITFLVACLAIAGIPPFAGFFSKDEILVAAYQHNKFLFFIEFAVAGLTAFYMFRLYFKIFWAKDTIYHHTPHESPFSMSIPLILLAIGSATAGFLPFSELVTSDGKPFIVHTHWNIALPSIVIAVAGISVATIFYKKENTISNRIVKVTGSLYQAAYHKFYFDEIYLFITKKIVFRLISEPIARFDKKVVDAAMDGIADITNFSSEKIKNLQSGQLQHYAYVFVSGALIITLVLLYILKL